MVNGLCIVLTVRMGSERLPNKAMANVAGKPLTYWIIERLRDTGVIILATTKSTKDDVLAHLGTEIGIPVFRGSEDDVIGRVEGAVQAFYPQARYVMRGLGDCPFHATEIVERACRVMSKYDADGFVWSLRPHTWPVYGTREFPFSRRGWGIIVERAIVREHIDVYFHEHRHDFSVVYHEPPPAVYFRPYRLEVDWPEDLELIRKVAEGVGMLAPLLDILAFLDQHQDIAELNRERVERTGPSTYNYEVKRAWMKAMRGQAIVGWDNKVWDVPSKEALPVFCSSGQCLLGLGDKGTLYMKDARITGDAWIDCKCGPGGGLRWRDSADAIAWSRR